ncbi:MAG: bile acid:sodium symporter family protein [Verrucomicrobiota bacterium]
MNHALEGRTSAAKGRFVRPHARAVPGALAAQQRLSPGPFSRGRPGISVSGPGSRDGALHPELLSNIGIALILFLQGLSLAWEKMKAGLGNWRLHVIIQAFTFGVFPVAGFALHMLSPLFWPHEPPAIRDGFLYLCVLPSTVSTSVVLTAVARGNTPGALFNAALSNIAGVLITPVLVHLLMQASGHAAPFGPLLIKITLLTLVPFAAGMVLRRWVQHWVDAHKPWINRLSNGVILFIVYTAFCDSVESRIWSLYGVGLTVKVLALVVLLFGGMSVLIYLVCWLTRLDRGDAIAAYFCSVKKTLAMGVPLAILIFGQRNDLSLILLPTMFYHPFQLFVNGLLANRWSRSAPAEAR